MSRKLIYMPDKGKNSLINFYDMLDKTQHMENGLLGDVFQELANLNLYHGGTIQKQLGVWLKVLDPNIVGIKNTRNKIKMMPNGTIIETILEASYDSLLKKIIYLASNNLLNRYVKQAWLPKFIDATSEFYCSKFHQDIASINPILGSYVGKNRSQEKKWFVKYMQISKTQPYSTTKIDKEAAKLADKAYPLGKKVRPINLFRNYCLPENQYFDSKCFELCFKTCGYAVDKNNPDESVKELILRVLEKGYYIDDPTWGDCNHSNRNLYFWFNRYTNISSKLYDEKFTCKIKDFYPQQFSKRSLKYDGFRWHDKIKDEFIEKLKINPEISADGIAHHFAVDKKFKELVEGMSVRPYQKVKLMKEEILKKVSKGLDFENFQIEINGKILNLQKLLFRCIVLNSKFTDLEFRSKIESLDNLLVSLIDKEFSKSSPSGKRLIREYNKIKSNDKEEYYFAVSPGWEVLPWLDYENKSTGGKYKSKFDPSFLAEVRNKTDLTREQIRNTWVKKYGSEMPYKKGSDFLLIKGSNTPYRHYTFNMSNSRIFYSKTKKDLSLQLGIDPTDTSAQIGSSTLKVWCKGKFFGWTTFKARILPNPDIVFSYLNQQNLNN